MSALVGALVLLLLGLVGARFSFNAPGVPLGPRFLFAAGTHFLVIGFLLGPHVWGLLDANLMAQLHPLLTLGVAWVGLLFGLQLDRHELARISRPYVAVALLQGVLVFLLFLGSEFVLLRQFGPIPRELGTALLVAAATASVSSPLAVVLVGRGTRRRGPLSQLLLLLASLDGLVGIIALQLTLAFFHPLGFGQRRSFAGGLEWVALALGLGLGFGVFFLWLTRPRHSRQELVLFLLGLAFFLGGSALYRGVSVLFVAMTTGAVIANFSSARRRVFAALQGWEKTSYVILLLLMGALLEFPDWRIFGLAAAYTGLRLVAKLMAGYAASRALPPGAGVTPWLGNGLIAQGGISLAMALSVTLSYDALGTDGQAPVLRTLVSIVVLAVVASELIGPILTRDLLARAGEYQPTGETG